MRLATGYQPKCARESCPETRAFALLEPPARQALVDLCAGLDAFQFSSPKTNPARRLLARGPVVTGAGLALPLAGLEELATWGWLQETPPAWGWLLGRLVLARGAGVLRREDLAGLLAAKVREIGRTLGPVPPIQQGQPWAELCDEWEARFWRSLSGRGRVRPLDLEGWRRAAAQVAEPGAGS
jgi:hypothetical protein